MPVRKPDQSHNISLFSWDVSNNKITLSSHFANLLAFETQDTTQSYDSWRALIFSDDLDRFDFELKNAGESAPNCFSLEVQKLCRNGKRRWFSLTGEFCEFDPNNRPLSFRGVCQDITEQKKSIYEASILKSIIKETKRVKLINVELYSRDNLYPLILEIFEKICGSEHSVLFFSSLINAKELLDGVTPWITDFKNNEIINLNENSQKLEFAKKIINNKKSCIKNINGTSFLGVHFDLPLQTHGVMIFERKKPFEDFLLDALAPLIEASRNIIAQQRLRSDKSELEVMLDFFFQQVPVPVAMFDTNMRYRFASYAWRRTFKIGDMEAILGKSHYDVCRWQPKEWRELHKKAMTGEIQYAQPENISHCFDSGAPLWLEGSIHPWYTLDGNIGGIIICSNDVTERQETSRKLNATLHELKESNQELERFAHVCSHDLKEPLRSVSNFIDLLFQENSENFTGQSVEYGKHILTGVKRMDRLIRDILEYSKFSSESKRTKRSNVNLNDLISQILFSLDYRIKKIDATLNVSSLPTIFCDEMQIYQVFINLIDNALKYRSHKKLIIDIFSVDKDSFWEIHIKDNGLGVDKEFQESIFNIFNRLHSKSEFEGSGVGLATCKKIINKHQGRIYIESVCGEGSDFIMTLPK